MTENEAKAWVDAHVSRETSDRLALYADLVRKWQKAINLVSGSTLSHIYTRHIVDSLQIFHLSDNDEGLWLDIGSGAGFPGMVCAIAAQDAKPELRFTMIESDQRKGAFLREVARHTGVKVTILIDRIEDAPPQGADILSARALAPLSTLCAFAERHLSKNGQALFPKGRNHIEEQKAVETDWTMTREIVQSRTDPDAVIYKIGELARV